MATRRMKAPARGVTVRMIRMGFGDCFLLAFRGDDGDPTYMLIDSGTHFRDQNPTERMKAAAEHVRDATGGHIHVLVGTHQHFDHLAGFNRARDIWNQITVGETWLAWTEEPGNVLADRLRQELARQEEGVRHALTRWEASLPKGNPAGVDRAALKEDRKRLAAVQAVLDFTSADQPVPGSRNAAQSATASAVSSPDGRLAADHENDDDDDDEDAAARVPRRSMADAYEWMKLKSAAPARYLRPTALLEEPTGFPGVRIYVLGPPEDEELLKRSDPSHGDDSEVYDLALTITPSMAFLAAAQHGTSSLDDLNELDRETLERSFPFEPRFRIPTSPAKDAKKALGDIRALYHSEEHAWRRIDSDWLRAAETLALKLDEDTNNTSLVLAVELIESRRVLLMVADAQVGNWLSWTDPDLTWTLPDSTTVTVRELLERTALYKVGHHGSHNSTLRELGLERMTSPELVAMIPTNERFADTQDWNIPFPPLLKRLKEKTRGRVLRADRVRRPRKPRHVGQPEWDRFKDALTVGRDYIEFTVE